MLKHNIHITDRGRNSRNKERETDRERERKREKKRDNIKRKSETVQKFGSNISPHTAEEGVASFLGCFPRRTEMAMALYF